MRLGASTALPRWLAGLLALTLALTAAHWLVLTKPVRIANPDDLNYQGLIDANVAESASTGFAQLQGRFYYATPLYWHNWEFYRLKNAWAFAAIRLIFLFLQFGLLAWLVARLADNTATGWLVLLAALAALHLPTTYFAALSYPAKWVGFCAILGSLHFQFTGLVRESRLADLISGLLFVLSALCLELFVCYLPLFVILALWQRPTVNSALRSLTPQLAGLVGYLLVYLVFSRVYPSVYGGTRMSFDIPAAVSTLLRQTVSIVPGFELLLHRSIPTGGGVWHKSTAELLAALRSTTITDCLLALLQSVSFLALTLKMPGPDRLPRYFLPVSVLCIFLPNLPISLTKMHQVLAFHRELPYIYGFYAYAALIVTVVVVFRQFSKQLGGSGWKFQLMTVLATTACLAVFLSAKISNRVSIGLLQSWFN